MILHNECGSVRIRHIAVYSDAEHECVGFHRRTGRLIKLITVQEILDEQFVQKM